VVFLELIVKTTTRKVYISGKVVDDVDDVASEVTVNVYIGRSLRVSLETSPHKLLELGIGFALVHGYRVDDLRKVEVKGRDIYIHTENNPIETQSLCSFSDVKVDRKKIFELFREAMDKAEYFKKTGGFHVSALATVYSGIVVVVEDISRHCALYKALGEAFLKGVNFRESIVLMSSRAALKLVEALANLCIPIAVFRGAPTFEAIDFARKASITLIAHVRGDRMNIYSYPERVL
jgi:FdhD protein